MGRIQNALNGTTRVDFSAVKAASLSSAKSLIEGWLPGGKWKHDEYVVLNPTRGDSKPGSFSINGRTGTWADFATNDRGGDLIDLYRYIFGGDALDAARAIGDLLGVAKIDAGPAVVHFPPAQRTAVLPPQETLRDPAFLPPRTLPDADGRPRYIVAGDEGPPVWQDELRRHPFTIGTVPVRFKVMRKGKDARAMNWYRVRDDADGTTGWQSRKPLGFSETPHIGGLDPFHPDHAGKTLFWPEGEKDADTLGNRDLCAFTFGGTGDGLPAGCEEYVRGRKLVILADNDPAGVEHAEAKAALAASIAESVKVVHFKELPPKGDVTDFFAKGGTVERLREIVIATPLYEPPPPLQPDQRDMLSPEAKPAAPVMRIKATAYEWVDPTTIPRREFVYGRHLIRKFVSATIAPGGIGKSSLIVSEALAMVSGKPLLGVRPTTKLRVWLWNLEDPREEIARHIQASAIRFRLTPDDIGDRLYVDSGRDQRLVMAVDTPNGILILEPVVDNLVAELKARQIDVIVIDPFVSSHEAGENDNSAMDRIVKAWGRVAQLANCAVELVHHARKALGAEKETTVDSARGGKALTDGCRSVRTLNRMTEEEAKKIAIEAPRSYFKVFPDKANLAPPAEKADWFHLESVDLGNGENGGYGDSVGVVVPFEWPDLMADLTVGDLRAVQNALASGDKQNRHSSQAADWVGKLIARLCGLNLEIPVDMAKAKHFQKVWETSGALVKVTVNDDQTGKPVPIVKVGEKAD